MLLYGRDREVRCEGADRKAHADLIASESVKEVGVRRVHENGGKVWVRGTDGDRTDLGVTKHRHIEIGENERARSATLPVHRCQH